MTSVAPRTSTAKDADTDPRDATNPYLFVVGCQRSGTTLLQRMLDHHPQLAVGYDSHFIPKPIKRLPAGIDPPLTPELVEQVRRFPRFGRLGIPDAETDRAAEQARTYSEFVSNLYSAFGRLHGKPLAGEKSPGYCRHLRHLHALFPSVRTIHLIRDGRDIALSVLDWKKGPAKLALFAEEPVAACALWWRRDVEAGRTEGQRIGPAHYTEVIYERLVGDPEPVMRELSVFLGLPYAPEMVAYHEGKTRSTNGRSAKAAWLPPTQGLRDWRAQMSERDRALFEALAGDLLTDLGYERTTEHIPAEIEAVAERCRAWWSANMRSRRSDEPDQRDRAARAREPVPSTSVNPYVFIVGCPRSGTTMLKRIVDAHPQIAVTPETHWIPRFYRKRTGITADGLVTPEFLPRLLEYHKFANLKIDRDQVETLIAQPGPHPYADVVSGILDLFGAHKGKTLVGDKTPGYVQYIPLLHELWPNARFVHLVRDGRDVCLSMLDWDRAPRTAGRYATWNEDPVVTTALWWERFVRLGREAARTLPGLTHEIRYEALVGEPEQVCADLCTFLDVPADEAMVRFHEGRTRSDPAMSPKRAWRPITAGIRDWRDQMSDEQIERFEATAGDLLTELGYERAYPAPREEIVRHAARLRDQFTKDPHFKERSLPAKWSSPA